MIIWGQYDNLIGDVRLWDGGRRIKGFNDLEFEMGFSCVV